jgi:hypothetical protein
MNENGEIFALSPFFGHKRRLGRCDGGSTKMTIA